MNYEEGPGGQRNYTEEDPEERRKRREQKRQQEMAARRKKVRLLKLGLAGAGVLLIVILACVGIGRAVSGKGEDSLLTAGRDQAQQSGQEGADGQGLQAAAEIGAQEGAGSADAQTGEGAQAGDGEDLSGGGQGEGAEGAAAAAQTGDPVSRAKLLAAGYDYDGAIALLSGDDSEEARALVSQWESDKDSLVAADVTTIPHVFFHSLINDDRAFMADLVGADRVRQNNAAMTTTVEFDAMIEDMYEAGYVLVGLDDMCVKTTGSDGTVLVSPNNSLMLPPDKKPFVLSVDDLSYYHSYGIGTQGYATKMVVDEDGRPKCVYTDPDGNTTVGDYDVVPRLDTFIREHPDFSYRGARGTVAMTGYNGVFGYRTNDYYKDINDPHLDLDQIQWLQEHPDFDWEQDCRDAKAVADAMKAEGWTFASHTYGHLNAESSDLERLMADNERWKTVNVPVLGETDKIIFAFGADIGIVGAYTADNAKFRYFKDQGYNIFCNVDGNIGWTEFGDTFMRTGRVALDGFTMYQAMTEGAVVHSVYSADYETLGISGISSFFNQYRPTPIDSE